MKKFFILAMALCTMSVFAQTNLFNANNASVTSTWGAGDINPTATWNAATGTLSITLNTDQAGWQWGNQVAFAHGVTFEAGKYYQVSMDFMADQNVGGVTFKVDDNTGMIYEDQKINLVANTKYEYKSAIVAGAAGGNNKMVFDFGHGIQGTNITVSNIVVVETEAPVVNLCEGTAVATSEQQAATLAIDGNKDTRWESKSADGDDVKWQMNLETPATFNRIKIVWEGAYAKDFNILAGNDCENLTNILTVTDQQLTQAQYTQIYELSESVTASHIQFQGVHRATVYGYSFYEFEVYTAQTSVLTSLDFTAAAAISTINGTVALTATPKDQYGATMAETVTYAVSPASVGHVADGVYTADAFGLATITATCGSLTKTVEIFNYTGENVALNKAVTAPSTVNEATRVNDGNDASEFQLDPNDGKSGHEVDAMMVIDLGAKYDLNLVTIHFEGACSDAYTLETSADSTGWNVAYTFAGTLGINNHTDYLYGENLANANGVRYIKFHSTKNATDWGCKIFEFQAFGVEGSSTGINRVQATKAVKTIQNGQLVITRKGVNYNVQGATL